MRLGPYGWIRTTGIDVRYLGKSTQHILSGHAYATATHAHFWINIIFCNMILMIIDLDKEVKPALE